jgi:hypothetical protein
MTQRYLQPQNTDILWDINATNITNINNHNMTMELSGNNGYVVNINNNRQLTIGNSYLHLPVGPSNERPTNISNGGIRFNTSLNVIEFYNGNWVAIESPPVLLSIFPSTVRESNIDISLNGANFKNNSTVRFEGQDGTTYNNNTVTFISDNLLIVKSPTPALPADNGPYSITIINPSGLFSTLSNILDAGTGPSFITSSGSIGTIYNIDVDVYQNILLPVTATDPDGDDISYNITSGSLPPNLSLNESSGAITGTLNSVVSDITFAFTVAAITSNATSTSNFSITVKAPITQQFTYNGYAAQNFSIPSTLTKITAKIWGSGGGSYVTVNPSGSGGAGGYSESTFNILSNETNLTLIVAGKQPSQGYTIGAYGGGGEGRNGGAGGGGASIIASGQISVPYETSNTGANNVNSSLSSLYGASGIILVAGGGGGAGWYVYDNQNGGPGGGIEGSSSSGGYVQNAGGTQSAGGPGNGNYDQGGIYLQGGTITNNTGGGGGSGGGGGGWYGGGVYQSSTGGENSAGGGGSGFVGFTDGTTSGTLIENYYVTDISGYTDSITRTNGSRTYTNSSTYRRTTAGAQYPPQYQDSDYISGVGEGNQESNGTGPGGNGLIVLKY